MTYSLYDSWTIEDTESIGKRFKAICKAGYSYEGALTIGQVYEIEVTESILAMSPLCKGIGDNGKKFHCHLTRFEKLSEVKS